MIVHQKANKGNDHLTDGLTAHLPLPDAMADWHWAMSLNQAVAIRTALEWFRSLPSCTGAVVWQLNDCWPVTSWAAVDGDERPKPLLYGMRLANAPRLVTVQPDADGLRVAIVNDTADAWDGELVLERRDADGATLASASHRITVPPRSSRSVPVPDDVASTGDPKHEVVVAGFGDERALWFFAEYRDSDLRAGAVTVDPVRTAEGWDVTVRAASLAREVTLLVDRLDPRATTDRALVTLLPGESAVIRVTGARDADPRAFADPLVLRSANDLCDPARVPAPQAGLVASSPGA